MTRKCADCGEWFEGKGRFRVTHHELGEQVVCCSCVDMYGGPGSIEVEPLDEPAEHLRRLHQNEPD